MGAGEALLAACPGNGRLPHYGLDDLFPLLIRLGFAPKYIVDIGANHGKWTRAALKYFPNAHYTLVEPQDNLKASIQDLIDQGYNLHWINAGAGDQTGTMMFHLSHRDDSSSFVPISRTLAPQTTTARRVPVAVRTLNEIVAASGNPVPEMVKIDAEGFDLKVLAGASQLFGKTEVFLIEAVICEPCYENTIQEVICRMTDAGYKLMDITGLNRSPKHGVLWLCDLAFVRKGSPLLKDVTSYE